VADAFSLTEYLVHGVPEFHSALRLVQMDRLDGLVIRDRPKPGGCVRIS
jgi:hypothetical protein